MHKAEPCSSPSCDVGSTLSQVKPGQLPSLEFFLGPGLWPKHALGLNVVMLLRRLLIESRKHTVTVIWAVITNDMIE